MSTKSRCSVKASRRGDPTAEELAEESRRSKKSVHAARQRAPSRVLQRSRETRTATVVHRRYSSGRGHSKPRALNSRVLCACGAAQPRYVGLRTPHRRRVHCVTAPRSRITSQEFPSLRTAFFFFFQPTEKKKKKIVHSVEGDFLVIAIAAASLLRRAPPTPFFFSFCAVHPHACFVEQCIESTFDYYCSCISLLLAFLVH